MKTIRITVGLLAVCALAACGDTSAPLSPEQAAPRFDNGLWTIGPGAVQQPSGTTAADTTSRGGLWTIGAGD